MMRTILSITSLCFAFSPMLAGEALVDAKLNFDRDIRPILSENCYACHGPDANNRQAGLRLDVRDDAIDGGAIEPGDVEASELVARLNHEDPDMRMPPSESHKQLDDKQKQALRRWITEGAEYQQHWSFAPRVRPDVPQPESTWAGDATNGLPASPADWIANPVDAFVLRSLQAIGVNPSPPANAHRLRRRVSLDLVGLPPAMDQVNGTQDDAPEHLNDADYVESLFRSPHHGERMASDWLDVVRYADTVGFHGDQNQNIFPYRDWVIDSINRNRPFDQFTRSQLAGDLLPEPTTEDLVASGFNRLNMMTREGGAQPGEYLAKYAADRVRTVGMAWMGLTTGCAECHDHKFDPFTAKDFYSLGAYFDDVKQWGVYSDYGYTPNPELKGGNNDYPFYPEMEVFSEALLANQQRVLSQMLDITEKKQFTTTEDAISPMRSFVESNPTGWKSLPPSGLAGGDRIASILSDGSIVPEISDERKAKSTRSNVNDITFDKTTLQSALQAGDVPLRSMRIELLTTPRHGDFVLRGGRGTPLFKFKFFAVDDSGNRTPVEVRRSDANRRMADYSGTQPILDVTDQWKVPRQKPDGTVHPVLDISKQVGEPLAAIFQFETPVDPNRQSLLVEMSGGEAVRLSFSVSPLWRLRPFDASEVDAWIRSGVPSGPAAVTTAMMFGTDATQSELARLEAEYRRCNDGYTMTMVTQAMPPKTTRVLPRGDWQDESGDIVHPAPPAFVGVFGESNHLSNHRQTRLDLADWIVHPDNPLTARVVVNRWWKHFFGTGLNASADDVGAQGEPPSHPELLDWLASELIDSGWDRRHILRLIVSSNTYRQDSRIRTGLTEIDPNNRLLAFHPPRRLEAEVVRDHALAVAGILNTTIGGPAAKPYQPPGYYSNLQFPDRDYAASKGEDQYRRGIYMHWQRTFLHPMLANFDAPSREDCVAVRATANTPQQALTLLNDPTFVEAARGLAVKVLRENGNDHDRIAAMITRSLQRPATTGEVEDLLAFLNEQRNIYRDDVIAADDLMKVGEPIDLSIIDSLDLSDEADSSVAEVAAWTATARVLLNLHESITRY